MGAISRDKAGDARLVASKACDEVYDPIEDRKLSPRNTACKQGVALLFTALDEANELSGKRGKKSKMGAFQECAIKCPEGFERVVTKRDKDDIPTVCICRLDPSTRKKFRGDKYRVPEEKRKPFGKWKSPVHLRRCVELDEKGRCRKKGLPGVTLRKISK